MSRLDSTNRRRFLASVGAGAAVVGAGCSGLTSSEPTYEDGNVSNVEGSPRNVTEMSTAQALAEQQVSDAVTPLETLALVEHEFVFEDGYLGSTVQGIVENTGDERVEIVEVRVRVYDADGTLLDRYLDRTGDLEGGTSWAFQVVLLESPGDIANYEITVLGTPA